MSFTLRQACNEKYSLAQGVEANSQLQADAGELLELVLLDDKRVREALAQQRIRDAKTLIALYWWLARREGA